MQDYSLVEHLGDALVRAVPRNSVRAMDLVVGGVSRPGIFAHAPSEIRFEGVAIGPSARLHFGVGIQQPPTDQVSDGVRFEVRVDDRVETPIVVWSRVLSPGERPEDRGWIDVALDLGAFEGRSVDLILITGPVARRDFDWSGWGEPVVQFAETPVVLRTPPVQRRELVHDPQVGSAREASARIAIGPRTVLDLAVEVRSRSLAAGERGEPVTFSALLDGEPVFRRDLRGAGGPGNTVGLAETVPLSAYSGVLGELVFSIDFTDDAEAQVDARWLRSAVVNLESTPRQEAGTGPNLLLVVVDTLRADHVGAYGYEGGTTPNFDRLAAESLLFEQAISSASWTMPAVASMLTGLYPLEHGVTDSQALDLRFETLGESLQKAGVSTFAVSANPIVGPSEGFHQGFEQFLHRPWANAEAVNEHLLPLLEKHRSLRWFGYVHYVDPHDPYRAPTEQARSLDLEYQGPYGDQQAFARLWQAVNFERGQAEMAQADVEYLLSAYDEEIRYWDSELNRVLEALEKLGLLDGTVLVVVSDHGEEFLDHGRLKHGLQLYEESIRVPLLIRAPGALAPGRRQEPVETRRLRDTLLDLMGVDGDPTPGRGLLAPDRGPLFSHTGHAVRPFVRGRTELASVRHGPWKYIERQDPPSSQLFDLSQDPGEESNLAQVEPGVASRLQGVLREWIETTRASRGEQSAPDPEILEKLRALGYVE